jgi:hypothetical protein
VKLAKYEAFFALTRLKTKGVLAQFVVRHEIIFSAL